MFGSCISFYRSVVTRYQSCLKLIASLPSWKAYGLRSLKLVVQILLDLPRIYIALTHYMCPKATKALCTMDSTTVLMSISLLARSSALILPHSLHFISKTVLNEVWLSVYGDAKVLNFWLSWYLAFISSVTLDLLRVCLFSLKLTFCAPAVHQCFFDDIW